MFWNVWLTPQYHAFGHTHGVWTGNRADSDIEATVADGLTYLIPGSCWHHRLLTQPLVQVSQQLLQQLLYGIPKWQMNKGGKKWNGESCQLNHILSEKSPWKSVKRLGWLCPGVTAIKGILCEACSLKLYAVVTYKRTKDVSLFCGFVATRSSFSFMYIQL